MHNGLDPRQAHITTALSIGVASYAAYKLSRAGQHRPCGCPKCRGSTNLVEDVDPPKRRVPIQLLVSEGANHGRSRSHSE